MATNNPVELDERPVEPTENGGYEPEKVYNPEDQTVDPDGDEPNADDLYGKDADWKDKELKRLRDENARRRVKAKEVEVELEQYRAEEKKRKDGERKKNGEYEQLLSETEAELERIRSEHRETTERLLSLEEASRRDLLKRLPSGLRKKYEGFDVSVLMQIVPDLVARSGSPGGGEPNPRPNDGPASLKGLSTKQIQDLKNGNPELYQKLMREYAR